MKALVCLDCVDIRALDDAAPVTCRCGQCSARWIDSAKGTVEVSAQDRGRVRILGIHNQFLRLSTEIRGGRNSEWAAWHTAVTEGAEGYLFHKDKRNCWVALIQVGESSDTFWAPDQP